MDSWVYDTASADTSVLPTPNPNVRPDHPFAYNGGTGWSWNFAQKNGQKEDINERKIDYDVHKFASADSNV